MLRKLAFSEVQAVAVFGAGHIAQALIPILINLPITIYWIDDRPLQFEEYSGDVSQINIICDNFSDVVDELPKDSYCLVITYSHQSDFEICEQVISHDSFSYLGMIGSKTKGNKFRERLYYSKLKVKDPWLSHRWRLMEEEWDIKVEK